MPSVLSDRARRTSARACGVQHQAAAAAPEVPTIAEFGYPGFDVNPWWGILAPAGTDLAIVRKINADVGDILRTQEMIDFLGQQGAEPFVTSPEAFAAILTSDVETWAKVVKAANVKIN